MCCMLVGRTSWTKNNVGWRFVSCVKGWNGCKYFVICDLLRRIQRTKEELLLHELLISLFDAYCLIKFFDLLEIVGPRNTR